MNKSSDINPELRDALNDIVQMNLSQALIQKPVYTLREILPNKTVADLKELAKAIQVAGYSKMKKPELVNAVYESLLNQKNVEMALICLEQDEWDFFKRAAEQKQITDNHVFAGTFLTVQGFGLLQAFFDGGEMIFVVPEEIRNVFDDIIRNGAIARIERSILIDCYARAAINLYGIIPLDELIEIFNKQNAKKTTEDELFSVLLQRIYEDSEYCFWKEYLVHSDFEDGDFEGVTVIQNAIRGKERFIPPKKEFLRYADVGYYERTPQLEKLEAFIIDDLTQDRMEAYGIANEIVLACMAEARLKEVISVFDEHGIVFKSKEQVERFMPILMDIWNNSRIWSNKGHTPIEIMGNYRRPVLRVLPGGDKKPGRNDFCPCGSGKKYKNCCGRNS